MTLAAWPSPSPAVACVGLSCRDHLWHVERFPPTHSRTHAHAYRSQGGGPAATAAVAAARLGADARLWAVHGDDEAGRTNDAELAAAGVDLRGARTVAGAASFVSAVLVGPDGDRHVFPYRGDGLEDEPAAHDWSGLVDAGVVLVDARHPRLAAHALAVAGAHGTPSVGDWGDLRHPELRARVTHLVVSEEAAREACGRDEAPSDDDRRIVAVEGAVALRAAAGAATSTIVVTLGELGCVWLGGDRAWIQSAPTVDVVDTNGAGDAFHGAYATAVAAGWTLTAAVRLATAVAATKCTGRGRDALPDLRRARALADALPAPSPWPHPHPAAAMRPGGTT